MEAEEELQDLDQSLDHSFADTAKSTSVHSSSPTLATTAAAMEYLAKSEGAKNPLSVKLQIKLQADKIDQRIENEKYIRR